jgi:hypothetical protein
MLYEPFKRKINKIVRQYRYRKGISTKTKFKRSVENYPVPPGGQRIETHLGD